MNSKIVLDIDGVLADFTWGLEQRMGLPDNPNVYSLYQAYPGREEEFRKHVLDPFLYQNLPVVLGAVKGVKWLYEHSYDMYAVTARPDVPGMRKVTKQWIGRNFRGLFKDVILAPSEDKPSVIQTLDPEFALDDSPDQVERARALGVRAVLFDRIYNRVSSPTHRTQSWSHFTQTLEALYADSK